MYNMNFEHLFILGKKERKERVKLADLHWFSNYVPWTSSISIIWKLARKANLGAVPQTYWIRSSLFLQVLLVALRTSGLKEM